MTLTPEQLTQYHNLANHLEALKRTKSKNSMLLQNSDNSKEQEEEIWQTSFVLTYMITTYQQHIALLNLLHNNKPAEALFNRFYALLAEKLPQQNDRLNPLETFKAIEEVMAGNEFKKDINLLLHTYEEKMKRLDSFNKWMIVIGVGLAIIAAAIFLVLAPYLLIFTPFIGYFIWAAVGIPVTNSWKNLNWEKEVIAEIDGLHKFLTDKSPEPGFEETYTYTVNHEDSIGTARVEVNLFKSHSTTDKALLRNSFFSSELKNKVKKEYDTICAVATVSV